MSGQVTAKEIQAWVDQEAFIHNELQSTREELKASVLESERLHLKYLLAFCARRALQTAEQLEVSCELIKTQNFRRYDSIPLLSNRLWRIEQGIVRVVTWNEEGTMFTLGYWGIQDVVGQPMSGVEPYEIQCLTDVQVSLLPKALWVQAIEAIVKQRQQTEELMSIVIQDPAARRLWLLLTFLSQKFGRDVEQGRLIDLRLTHQELAELARLTRVTVTRILQRFEAEGKILRFLRGRLILRE